LRPLEYNARTVHTLMDKEGNLNHVRGTFETFDFYVKMKLIVMVNHGGKEKRQ
jgi:hypothetical protein